MKHKLILLIVLLFTPRAALYGGGDVTTLRQQLASLRAAIDDLAVSFPDRFRAEEFRTRLEALNKRADTAAIMNEVERLKFDALVAGNPLLSPGKLLFVKRHTYTPGWYYAEFMRATRFGGGLCVLSLPDGKVTELFPQLSGGITDRYDLSFDGQRIVFAFKKAIGKAFRLYEARVDGTGLRQLTFDPPDEAQRVARFHHPKSPYFHTTDDFHPCYLPDGGIVFASARCERGVLCDEQDDLAVNLLYRVDADGRNLHRLSEGALSESTPSVMNDGRILYTRWEYVDKGVIAVQSLWAMRPDGTGSREIYGNYIEDPMVFIHGRAIPGQNNLFVCTATFHHPFAVGPLLLVDTTRPIHTLEPIFSLTPDTRASSTLIRSQTGAYGEKFAHLRDGKWIADNKGPLFAEPYPLVDPETNAGAGKFFLATCNPDQPWGHGSAYGLWLIDVFGNRVRIHSDPAISCWQPMPLRARQTPPVLTPIKEQPGSPNNGTLVLSDIYRGLEGVAPGTVKYLRVLEQVPRPWSAHRFWPNDSTLGQHAPISMYAHIFVKINHGVVPVHDDGSAHFTVPSRRNIFFQALDENFMEVQRMRTFVNLQPGETRGCVGCHERLSSPPGGRILALAKPPVAPVPQPGETVPRPIHYVTDVQPVLDRHCVRCHGGAKTEGGLDLTGTLTQFFNRSYENIMRRNLLSYITEFVGPAGNQAQFTNVVPLPARALGSHASKFIAAARGPHHDVQLSQAELIRLITWADANGPYYGSYFGRRNLIYKDHPNFRPVPTLASALGDPTGTEHETAGFHQLFGEKPVGAAYGETNKYPKPGHTLEPDAKQSNQGGRETTLASLRSLHKERKWKELIEQYARTNFADWPENLAAEAFYLRGQTYSALKLGKQAEADLKSALKIMPRQELFWLGLADNYHYVLSDEEQALKTYRHIFQLTGKNNGWLSIHTTLSMVRILTDQVKTEEALGLLKAFGTMDGMASVWKIKMLRAYGHVYAAQGKETESLAAFREALYLETQKRKQP